MENDWEKTLEFDILDYICYVPHHETFLLSGNDLLLYRLVVHLQRYDNT